MSPQDCAELRALAASVPAAGHVPHVHALPVSLLALAAPQGVLPLLRLRDSVLAAAERSAGSLLHNCAAEDEPLFVEFCSLLTWLPGSELSWHDDVSGGPHLQHRHLSGVVYLSSGGSAFSGGEFASEGRPLHTPAEGELVLFAASLKHAVLPVTSGRRVTFTFWLTRNGGAAEDTALLAGTALRAAAGGETLPRLPQSLFCGGEPGVDARVLALTERRLRLDGDGDEVWLMADGNEEARLRVLDASHGLALAVHAEQAFGACLADCVPFGSGPLAAEDVRGAHDAAVARARQDMGQLMPRWLRAGGLWAE